MIHDQAPLSPTPSLAKITADIPGYHTAPEDAAKIAGEAGFRMFPWKRCGRVPRIRWLVPRTAYLTIGIPYITPWFLLFQNTANQLLHFLYESFISNKDAPFVHEDENAPSLPR